MTMKLISFENNKKKAKNLNEVSRQLGRMHKSLNSIDEIRLLDDEEILTSKSFQVFNNTFFVFDANDTTTPDDGSMCIVTESGRRMKRQYSFAVLLSWFGGVGDGLTDNTQAFQKCFSYLSSLKGGQLALQNGNYIAESITIPRSVTIQGESLEKTIITKKTDSNGTLVNCLGSDYSQIRDVTFEGNKATTTGNCIDYLTQIVGGSTYRCRKFRLDNVRIRNFNGNGIEHFSGAWNIWTDTVKIDDCTGYGIYIKGSDSDYINITTAGNMMGGIRESGGNNHHVNHKHTYNSRNNPDGGAMIFQGAARCICSNIECQDNYFNGFNFQGAKNITLSSCVSDANGRNIQDGNIISYGYRIENSRDILLFGQCANYNGGLPQLAEYYISESTNIQYKVIASVHQQQSVLQNSTVKFIDEKDVAFNKSTIYSSELVYNSISNNSIWTNVFKVELDTTLFQNERYSLKGEIILSNLYSQGIITKSDFDIELGFLAPTNYAKIWVNGLKENVLRIVKKEVGGIVTYFVQLNTLQYRTTYYSIFKANSSYEARNAGLYIENELTDNSDIPFVAIDNYNWFDVEQVNTTGSYIQKGKINIEKASVGLGSNSYDGAEIFKINLQRPWILRQKGIDGNSYPELMPDSDGKRFKIVGIDSKSLIDLFASSTTRNEVFFNRQGGNTGLYANENTDGLFDFIVRNKTTGFIEVITKKPVTITVFSTNPVISLSYLNTNFPTSSYPVGSCIVYKNLNKKYTRIENAVWIEEPLTLVV